MRVYGKKVKNPPSVYIDKDIVALGIEEDEIEAVVDYLTEIIVQQCLMEYGVHPVEMK